jgi:hypothetical protein
MLTEGRPELTGPQRNELWRKWGLAVVTLEILARRKATRINGWITMFGCGDPGNSMSMRFIFAVWQANTPALKLPRLSRPVKGEGHSSRSGSSRSEGKGSRDIH